MGNTNPVITAMDENGKIAKVKFIDGKNYKLQHPGNRIALEWQKEYLSLTEGIDIAKFLDKAFEHCVIPEGHDFKPTIDNVKPKELGVWQRLLRRFLDGDLGMVPLDEEGADAGRTASRSGTKNS